MNIAQLRKRLRYTQAELAEYCGVTAQTVANWEAARNAPPAVQLNKLRELEARLDGKTKANARPRTASVGEIVDALNALSEPDRRLIIDLINRLNGKRPESNDD